MPCLSTSSLVVQGSLKWEGPTDGVPSVSPQHPPLTGRGPDACLPVLCFSGCCPGCLGRPSHDCTGERWWDQPPPLTPCSGCASQRLKERQGDARHLREQGLITHGWGHRVSSDRQDKGRGPMERVTQPLGPSPSLISLSALEVGT